MSKIIHPKITYNIKSAATSLPIHGPITNLDILNHFPRMMEKKETFLQNFSRKIDNEFGFATRYWAHLPWQPLHESREETSEKLSLKAVTELFKHHPKTEVDAFILGSTTNKRYTGSQACAVLGQLGIEAPAWDMKAGCSTSLASLHQAYSLMALGYDRIVVSCAETLSKVIDPVNELTYFGLADGGAAVYLEKDFSGQFSVDTLYFSSKGQYVDAFTTTGLLPPNEQELTEFGYRLQGDEHLLKGLAYDNYTKMLNQILSRVDKFEIKWIIPHQVNRQLIDTLILDQGLEHCELIWHAHEFGNMGGASVLFSLAKAFLDGRFNADGKILMMSVGGGLTFAAHVIDFKKR